MWLLASNALAADCVVLLHGLARGPGAMAKLGRVLADDGYSIVNDGYPSRRHPIEELAPLAIDPALAKCKTANTDKVHFVTHSLGGILVRAYLAANTVENLGRVVMLGPPNHGSEVVDVLGNTPAFRWANGPAGAELGTDPATSKPLRLGPANFDVGVIAGNRTVNFLLSRYLPGADDGKVSVESTKLDGMADHIVLAATHTFMMSNRQAIEQVRYFLDHGQFKRNDGPD
ncbi:MAG: alpha/beta hydrolase [Pseudomonadota bacterium]